MTARRTGALALAVPLLLAACAAPADQSTSATQATTSTCSPETMATRTPGTLTIATDDPAYAPWFAANDPSNRKGYESAVAYAVAGKLGFSADKVTWVRVPFNSVVQPGDHQFDFDVNEVSITEERRKAVDFSSGYYDIAQTVITTKNSPIAKATSIAGLKNAKLGAVVSSTSYTAITNQIKPSNAPAVFDTNDAAVQALKNGQVDGIVVDLPTAFYMTGAQLSTGVIVGQLPQTGNAEQLGAVLPKGSPLTGCVSQAIDALRADGTLAKLEKTWLSDGVAPVLPETDGGATTAPAGADPATTAPAGTASASTTAAGAASPS